MEDFKVPYKEPQNYDLLTYIWIFIISILAGTARTVRRIKEKKLLHFSFSEWAGDVTLSGFIGLITFYLCEYFKIEPPLNAAIVGIIAHQGTNGLIILEEIITKRLKGDVKNG